MTIKLSSIVRNYHPWHSKHVDNVLLDKALYLVFYDYYQRFFFDPFCEIINSNKQKLNLLLTLWQWANNINPPN